MGVLAPGGIPRGTHRKTALREFLEILPDLAVKWARAGILHTMPQFLILLGKSLLVSCCSSLSSKSD